ncbi:hypothetical protein CLAIMM_10656 [Cladophialophora immunda]|nr:hypothetical protein CLAIMM_10656 [Cladophialophora immunda]
MAPPSKDLFGDESQGVGRGQLNVFIPVLSKSPQEQSHTPLRYSRSEGEHSTDLPRRHHSLLRSLKAVRKIQNGLLRRDKHVSHPAQDSPTEPAPILAPTPPQDTTNVRLGPAVKEKPNVPRVEEFFRAPVSAARQLLESQGGEEFAENVAKSEVSHGASVAMVLESEKLEAASTSGEESCDPQFLESLKQLRQDSFTRWTIDRHVRHIGRIQAQIVSLKRPKDFVQHNEDGIERIQWRKYGQHLRNYTLENYTRPRVEAELKSPEPSRELLASSCERVLLVSKPLQSSFLNLRRISSQGMIILVISSVSYRRLCPPTIEEMHTRLARAEDTEQNAQNLSDLIVKYGVRGWVDRIIETAGPVLLHNCESLADMLEIMQNFYEWRNPRETSMALCRLVLLLAIVTIVPTQALVRGLLCVIGFVFFAETPVTALLPRYRSFISPLTWLFWRVPTHADWAIGRLKAEAKQQLQVMQRNHTLKPKSDFDVGSYKCKSGDPGRLTVTTDRLSFVPSRQGPEQWTIPYERLQRIHKVPRTSLHTNSEGLLFVTMDEAQYEIAGLRHRDEVFSQIVGYSDVQWKKTG